MFENLGNFFKKMVKPENKELGSKDDAKERLHLVLMQDRANVSADFLELMKQEIIDVIKKYIVVDEASIDVRLTNKPNEDGTTGAPALYANIPIVNIKNDMKAEKINEINEVAQNRLDKEKNLKAEVDNNVEQTGSVDEKKNEVIEEKDDVLKKDEKLPEEKKETKTEIDVPNENEQVQKNANSNKGAKKTNKKSNNANSNNTKSNNTKSNNKQKVEEGSDEEDEKDVTFDELLKVAEEDLKKSEVNKK